MSGAKWPNAMLAIGALTLMLGAAFGWDWSPNEGEEYPNRSGNNVVEPVQQDNSAPLEFLCDEENADIAAYVEDYFNKAASTEQGRELLRASLKTSIEECFNHISPAAPAP